MQSVLFWGGLAALALSFVMSASRAVAFRLEPMTRDGSQVEAEYEKAAARWMAANAAKGQPTADDGPVPELADPPDGFVMPTERVPSATGW